jgi:hypothetical protein
MFRAADWRQTGSLERGPEPDKHVPWINHPPFSYFLLQFFDYGLDEASRPTKDKEH